MGSDLRDVAPSKRFERGMVSCGTCGDISSWCPCWTGRGSVRIRWRLLARFDDAVKSILVRGACEAGCL